MAGRPKSKSESSWRILLAFLCIVLVVICGTIRVVHAHPDGDVYHADCALCATAHAVVQVTVPPVLLHITHVESVAEALLVPKRPAIYQTFALFTRPPPVDASLA